MPGAVADASTLISLAAIGRLELLHVFHGKIMVPLAVWREVMEDGQGRPGTAELEEARRAGWIEVVVPRNTDLVTRIPSLRAELDRLLRERGFYLSDAIYQRVLQEAGEDVLS